MTFAVGFGCSAANDDEGHVTCIREFITNGGFQVEHALYQVCCNTVIVYIH